MLQLHVFCLVRCKSFTLCYIIMLQLHVFCLVRGQPDVKALDRVEQTLRQYRLLHSGSGSPTQAQTQLSQHISTRVTAIRGTLSHYTVFSSVLLKTN